MSAATLLAVLITGLGYAAICTRRRRQARQDAVAILRQARIDDIQARLTRAVPAADDNTAGINADDLSTCRHIHNGGTAHHRNTERGTR